MKIKCLEEICCCEDLNWLYACLNKMSIKLQFVVNTDIKLEFYKTSLIYLLTEVSFSKRTYL